LTLPSGLPADSLSRDGEGWSNPLSHTSPTNIAAYLWSTLAAERLHLIGSSEARSRLDRTLATLAGMDRTHGLFFNMLDPRTGAVLKVSPFDSSRVEPYLSAVDNAWLAVALTMVANSELSLRERAGRLLEPIDFRFFYDPYDAADPVRHPGQLYVGYQTDDHTFYGHYGMLNTEARIASYLGIARGQLPPEHYYRMFRTLPENLGPQQQSPRGTTRDYYGVRVFEGSYDYRGADRPELGREHVRGLDGDAVRPRGCLGPAELGDQSPALCPGADRPWIGGGRLRLLGFLARRQSARGIRGLRREGPGDLHPRLFLL
jgi:hypothetical protein